jgi:hypothetical protein
MANFVEAGFTRVRENSTSKFSPAQTSELKLRRPCGTELGNGVLTHPRKASLDKVGHFVMRTEAGNDANAKIR